MRLILGSVIAIAIVFGFLSARAAESEISVTVGTANSVSDAPLYIADKKGFFKEAGLLVTTTQFNSAPNMVAPLGAGQLDVGAGSASAALYNAVARGLKIKIVADKASSPPGYGATKLLVRKDLIESGRFKSLVSLKGMTIAMNAPGVSNTSTLNSALHSVGLSYSDVSTVNLSFPDHLIALLNKSVDAGVTTKPTATAAVKSGAAVEIKRDDEIDPGHQIAVLLFSEYFSAKREAAVRFMRTYQRAVGFYNGALSEGRLAGPNAEEVVAILAEYTPLKDVSILRSMTPTGCDIDGRVNQKSLQNDLAFYSSQGLINGDANLAQLIDMSYVEEALRGIVK